LRTLPLTQANRKWKRSQMSRGKTMPCLR